MKNKKVKKKLTKATELEGQRLPFNSHWTACPTLPQRSISCNSLSAQCSAGYSFWPHDLRSNNATDSPLRCAKQQFQLASSPHPVCSGSNGGSHKDCLPFQHAQVENKQPGSTIPLQLLTPESRHLEEMQHPSDGTTSPCHRTQTTCMLSCARLLRSAQGFTTLITKRCTKTAKGNEEGNESPFMDNHTPRMQLRKIFNFCK